MKRRTFIRLSSTGAIGAATVSGLATDWFGAYGSRAKDPGTEGDRVVPSFCELCFWKCGILVHVRNGRVTKIKGNPKDPLSNGRLCPRGAGGAGTLYDPDRLKKPMIRRSVRGADEFEEVPWEAALDVVAENFERIKARWGAGALALFSHGYGGSWMKHLFRAYGSPNIAAPSYAQCRGPRDVGFDLTFGWGVGSPENTDIAHTRCLVLVGSHLGENMHNTQVQEFSQAIRNGAAIIVVDPRFSVAAGKSHEWLPIKPGTDLALLLAWMNVLVEEDLYDRDYVEKYTYGFEQLEAHLRPYTPEWAYTRTGLDPEQIRRTARMMGGARPAVLVHPGRRVTWYGNDTQRSRAIAILNALLGSWGRRGGFFIPAALEIPPYDYPDYSEKGAAPADREEPSQYPFADEVLAQGICRASIPTGVDDSRIKGWMVYGSNLPLALPDPPAVFRAVQELEFLVTVDILPSEIVGWSDVVLPESTYLERCDELLAPPWRIPYVALRQEVVPPMYDTRPGWWIARELGKRIGLSAFFPWADSMEYAKVRLEKAGLDCHTLQQEGVILGTRRPIYFEEGAVPVFPTPSGKIELYSRRLAAHGFDPIPTWHDEDLEDPPPGYYRLLFGRSPVHSFGRTTNNRLLGQVMAENAIWVNRQVAKQWGLAEGDRVYLQNQDGVRSSFSAPVKITQRIHPDAVYLVHGFGRKAQGLSFAFGRGIDDAELITRYQTDPIMGGTGMNVNYVTFLRPSQVTRGSAAGGSEAAPGAALSGSEPPQGEEKPERTALRPHAAGRETAP